MPRRRRGSPRRPPRGGQPGRDQHKAAESARPGLTVVHDHAPRVALAGEHRRRFARALTGAREPLGDVHRDDVPACLEERSVDSHEVADRRLRCRRQPRRLTQAQVELVEVGYSSSRRRSPSHPTYRLTVTASDAVDQRLRQVRRAVRDDRYSPSRLVMGEITLLTGGKPTGLWEPMGQRRQPRAARTPRARRQAAST